MLLTNTGDGGFSRCTQNENFFRHRCTQGIAEALDLSKRFGTLLLVGLVCRSGEVSARIVGHNAELLFPLNHSCRLNDHR